MSSNQKNFIVLALTMLIVGLPTAALTLSRGADAEALGLALRITARSAFLVFLLVFVARPLRQISRRTPASLAANRRYLGIAFAAVMTVHLGFIVWLHGFLDDRQIPIQILAAGGLAYTLMYLMLLTSFDRTAAALGPRNWRRLHKTGLYWIGLVFAYTLVSGGPESGTIHIVLAALFAAALAVRVTAFFRSRLKDGGDRRSDM